MNLKFDQIAVYTDDLPIDVAKVRSGGHPEWTFDKVVATAVMGEESEGEVGKFEFTADLAFNYSIINGMEFEFIEPGTYSYIKDQGIQPGQIAHMGVHLLGGPDSVHDDGAAVPSVKEQIKYLKEKMGLAYPIQRCITTAHANPNVPHHRRYSYIIWKSVLYPWPVKTIERISSTDPVVFPEHV